MVRATPTVLILTDGVDVHSGIGWLLQKRGYRAIEVGSKREVLEHACHATPKLILIDTDHPPRESLALARSLRDESDLADTQIVVVTSEDQSGSQNRPVGYASDYLISRDDSAGIMELLADLDSSKERPLLRRAHRA